MAAHLRITSKIAGFRRAGLAHPATPVDHLVEKFSAEQIDALKAEAMLTVEEIDTEPTKRGATKQPVSAKLEGGTAADMVPPLPADPAPASKPAKTKAKK